MNYRTITRLNTVTKVLADAFVMDAEYGHTTYGQVASLKARVKYPTPVEVVKAMIRKDMSQIDTAFLLLGINANIKNILKTPRQLDYVASGVVESLKTAARKNALVKDIISDVL